MTEMNLSRPDDSAVEFHSMINDRGDHQPNKPGTVRRGERTGWDSPEARALRKGWHDIRSGRITPESLAVAPTEEFYAYAWRSRGLLGPSESQRTTDHEQTVAQAMQAGIEVTPIEPIQ